jgi:hypothetical protein
MSGDDELVLDTRVAHAGWEDHVFRGFDVFRDLAGSVSLTNLLSIAVTGRRLTTDEVGLLDDIAAVWTVADPRIWPLKITRLASSYGGTIQGVAAGMLCLDCLYIGVWATSRSAALWQRGLMRRLGPAFDDTARREQALLKELSTIDHVPGYGVPFRAFDERVPPFCRRVEERQRQTLPYWSLYESTTELVRRERGIEPNAIAPAVAACLDLGFTPEHMASIFLPLLTPCFLANAHEGASQAPSLLRRLPDDTVTYVGAPSRRSPRRARVVEARRRLRAQPVMRSRAGREARPR